MSNHLTALYASALREAVVLKAVKSPSPSCFIPNACALVRHRVPYNTFNREVAGLSGVQVIQVIQVWHYSECNRRLLLRQARKTAVLSRSTLS